MTLYDKIVAVVQMIRNSIATRAEKTDLAAVFSSGVTYEPDRLVIYNNRLYGCTETHSGEWNASHFAPTNIDEVLATKGSGGGIYLEEIYLKDSTTGLYHKITLATDENGLHTIDVDENGIQEED